LRPAARPARIIQFQLVIRIRISAWQRRTNRCPD
jgi:hypothetical protein